MAEHETDKSDVNVNEEDDIQKLLALTNQKRGEEQEEKGVTQPQI